MDMSIRAAALRGVDGLIADLGGDPRELLGEFGVTVAEVDSDEAVLPAATIMRILRTAARRLDCPDFGLRLAGRQDLSMLGPLALAVANCDTLGGALECASRFLFVHNPTLRLSRVADPEHYAGVAALAYRMSLPDIPHDPQAVDAGLGLLHRCVGAMSGGYELLGVHLPPPPLTDPAVYAEFFGAPVRFGADEAVLRMPAKMWDQAVSPRVNPELRRMVVDYLEANYTDPRDGLTVAARSAVGRALGTVPVRLELIAGWLHLHPRTLQRRLAAEGTTFEAIVDDARRTTALRLLTRTDLPLSQVASLIELAGQSALTRASRRWFADTPSRVRRAARSPRPAGAVAQG
ncbi:AraC family transcriptional regulator [Nocardia thailandica]